MFTKEPKYMRLRTSPYAVRLNLSSKHTTPHEYLYSELFLYKPFRCEEEELFAFDQEKCADLYLQKADSDESSYIEKIKNVIMPSL